MEPIRRSAYGFCQGLRGAVSTSSICKWQFSPDFPTSLKMTFSKSLLCRYLRLSGTFRSDPTKTLLYG